MSIALITGGNKGLGKATARRLAELGHTVYIGARDAERGQTAADELGVPWLQLDVTDDASVDAAAAELAGREGRLDILVNNAGVGGRDVKPDDLTADDLREAYDVNVFGLIRVTHAFLPLLHRSQAGVIVNVSSRLGAFGAMTDPDSFQYPYFVPVYGSSKSAVNMLTVQLAKALPQLRINAVEPGLTATDLHGLSGPGVQTPEEGAEYIVRLATVPADGPTGTFSYDTP
ncbi:MAG TPA: SDR family NAD(P)-dependent oxidoreductase, partial [Streptosporangiaceae bacterium]